jgi:uncharacterized membrane protein
VSLRITPMETATAIIAAAQGALALFIQRFGVTEPIPMHFNIQGEVDRWGDRAEAAGVLGLIAAITLIAGWALAFDARRRDAGRARRRALAWGQFLLLATTSIVAGMLFVLASGGVGSATSGPHIVFMAVCIVFAVIGAVVGKVPPNALVGVRTPWSLTSRLAWEKSNRLAGRLFFWTGMAGLLLTPALPRPLAVVTITTAALLIGALSVFESWRVWRTDPERGLT